MTPVLLAFGIFNLTHQQFPVAVYEYKDGIQAKFNIKVQLEGYIPLFGGRNGNADVDMVVLAKGMASDSRDIQSVESEVVDIKATAFGSMLPLTKKNIEQFYPKGTATFTTGGAVKSNTVKEQAMQVKLPGLDSRRLPEISYIPLVLDWDAIQMDKDYSFERTFNDVPMKYTVTPGKRGTSSRNLDIQVVQNIDGFEDAYGNPSEESAAKSKVRTVLTGKGTAIFDFMTHTFDKVVIETNAESEVIIIKTGKSATRKLKTTLTIVRDGAKVDQ